MNNLKWWQQAVFYQIYPRSFADGNGDGIGDFPGITAKLDYLRDLGIDAIWLSPHYPSPFLDCGYDISDYTAVAPEYGTLDDFKTFLNEAHARGIRVVLDAVLNHTSDQHPWFVESRSNRDNPKRDWYVWRDGRDGDDGGPPNNWASIFGGSAWKLDSTTGQYYYHAFLDEQPDLNWRNAHLKRAMWDALRFWLDLGVDGFRLDAIGTIFEDPDLPDHALALAADQLLDANALTEADYRELLRYQLKQPGLHELMQELRALLDEYPGDRVLIGEDSDVAFHGLNNDELHLVFNFPLLQVDQLTPAHIRANQAVRLAALPPGAWPCNTLGNHDCSRVWSRFNEAGFEAEHARLNLVLMLTLKGTPFLYNGEEIGMADFALRDPSQLRDTAAINQHKRLIERLGRSPEDAWCEVVKLTRDRCRTPMQWSSAPNGGFCPADTQPWLPMHANVANGVHVEAHEADAMSLLNDYRRLLRLRRSTPALVAGDYAPLNETNDAYFAFTRHDANTGQTCFVVLNFNHNTQSVAFDLAGKTARVLYSSTARTDASLALDGFALAPLEALIVELL